MTFAPYHNRLSKGVNVLDSFAHTSILKLKRCSFEMGYHNEETQLMRLKYLTWKKTDMAAIITKKIVAIFEIPME